MNQSINQFIDKVHCTNRYKLEHHMVQCGTAQITRRDEFLWAGVTSYNHIHGTHSSEGKGNRGKRTSNHAWTQDLCSIAEFQPREPRRPVEILHLIRNSVLFKSWKFPSSSASLEGAGTPRVFKLKILVVFDLLSNTSCNAHCSCAL